MVSKSLLLCEGGDDVGFLKKFCKYLNLKNIDIQKMSNKSNFFKEKSYLTIKQKVDKGLYSKVLFIIDADYPKNDAKGGGLFNSEKCLQKIITTLGFIDKSKYYVACDPIKETGNLEHLVLSTLDNKQKKCIESLLDCVLEMDVHSDKKIVLSSYEAIFKESPYNLPHKNFDKLRERLEWLDNDI
jgi:hypothetical protein